MKTSKVKAKVERGLKAAAKLRAMEDASAWLQTYTGRAVTPLAVTEDQVDFSDIAHALSHQCRFAGHTHRFYSVAEHSMLVHSVADVLLTERGFRGTSFTLGNLYALLHDASEAYLCDLPAPLKRHPAFAEYRAIEKQVQETIERKLIGVTMEDYSRYPEDDNTRLSESIRDADLIVLKFEADRLLLKPPKAWGLPDSRPWQDFSALRMWSPGQTPDTAWSDFIRAAVKLTSPLGLARAFNL